MNLTVTGIVEEGHGDGKKLGFPTANLLLDNPCTLEYGVYAAWTTVDGNTYKSVLHYGPRLIFKEQNPLFEVHLIDFNADLYSKKMTVKITDFLRGTQFFENVEDLVTQMEKDKQKAIEVLAQLPS